MHVLDFKKCLHSNFVQYGTVHVTFSGIENIFAFELL
jgi:hypothetical protein